MSADRVEITSEVFWACSMHAMSTEVEEIMGLLLGEFSVRAMLTQPAPCTSHMVLCPLGSNLRGADYVNGDPIRSELQEALFTGDVVYADDGSSTVRIWAVMPQIRTDRRKVSLSTSPTPLYLSSFHSGPQQWITSRQQLFLVVSKQMQTFLHT